MPCEVLIAGLGQNVTLNARNKPGRHLITAIICINARHSTDADCSLLFFPPWTSVWTASLDYTIHERQIARSQAVYSLESSIRCVMQHPRFHGQGSRLANLAISRSAL